MAYRHHHHAPGPAPDPGNAAWVAVAAGEMHARAAGVGSNNIPVTGGADGADGATIAQARTLPAPSMAASLAATAASLAVPALQPGADDAGQTEDAAFHQHRMETQVFAHLWRHV